jgi:serine/threonine protein kinase
MPIIVTLQMVTGTPPFNADTPEDIFENILNGDIPWPEEEEMSDACRDIIQKLLTFDPEKRLGHRGAGNQPPVLQSHHLSLLLLMHNMIMT